MSDASSTSKPETPTNGVASLSLTVPDDQLTAHSEEVKQSDTSSSVSSPFSPSGVFRCFTFNSGVCVTSSPGVNHAGVASHVFVCVLFNLILSMKAKQSIF